MAKKKGQAPGYTGGQANNAAGRGGANQGNQWASDADFATAKERYAGSGQSDQHIWNVVNGIAKNKQGGGSTYRDQEYQAPGAPSIGHDFTPSAAGQAKLDAFNRYEQINGPAKAAPGWETGEFVRTPEQQATQDRLKYAHEGGDQGAFERDGGVGRVATQQEAEEFKRSHGSEASQAAANERYQQQQQPWMPQQQQQMPSWMQSLMGGGGQQGGSSKKQGQAPSYQQNRNAGYDVQKWNSLPQQEQQRYRDAGGAPQQQPRQEYYGEGSSLMQRNRPIPQTGYYGGGGAT